VKDMKKEIKDWTNKSCKNCENYRNCVVRIKVEEVSYIDTDFWSCSRWGEKKKTIKLYAYLIESTDKIFYGSHLMYSTNEPIHESIIRVPSLDKEVTL